VSFSPPFHPDRFVFSHQSSGISLTSSQALVQAPPPYTMPGLSVSVKRNPSSLGIPPLERPGRERVPLLFPLSALRPPSLPLGRIPKSMELPFCRFPVCRRPLRREAKMIVPFRLPSFLRPLSRWCSVFGFQNPVSFFLSPNVRPGVYRSHTPPNTPTLSLSHCVLFPSPL